VNTKPRINPNLSQVEIRINGENALTVPKKPNLPNPKVFTELEQLLA